MVYIFNLLTFSIVVIHPSQKSRYTYSCFPGISTTASNKCISKRGQRPGPSLILGRSPRYHRTTVTPISWCIMRQLVWSVTLSCKPSDLRVGREEVEEWMSEDNRLVHPYAHQHTPVRLLHCPSTHSLLTQAVWTIVPDFCNEMR